MKVKEVPFEDITEEQFIAYEKVRRSGVVNMFDVEAVSFLSELDLPVISGIMRNYRKLMERYPNVRRN